MNKRLWLYPVLMFICSLPAAAGGGSSIVGGKTIGIAEAPWQLLFRISGGSCGATWLGGRWALTAAHCVQGGTASNAFVWAGITRASQATTANRTPIRRIIGHPGWNGSGTENSWKDIALLELAADITAPLARPILYATSADAAAGVDRVGAQVWATGWGSTSANGGSTDSLKGVQSVIHASSGREVINWGGQGGTTLAGSCFGDSGGPLAAKNSSGTWLVIGVSSFIHGPCGAPTTRSAYTRVSAFAEWIRTNSGGVTALASGSPPPYSVLPGILRIARDQDLDIAFFDFTGARIGRQRGFYTAGKHSLPGNLPSGSYLLRVRGAAGTWESLIQHP